MQAVEYINNDIPYLKDTDNVEFALDVMTSNSKTMLPVVQNWKYMGMIGEDFLLNISDLETKLGSLPLAFSDLFVYENQHVFDLIKNMIESSVFTIAVLGKKNQYIGVANAESIIKKFGVNISIPEIGGTIVLQMNKSDYSLSEIARIVESNDGIILNCFISSNENISQIEVTLKINKPDLTDIIASFERFEYNIKAVFHQAENEDDLLDKYQSLMHYLNM